jgi:hypothetical protein
MKYALKYIVVSLSLTGISGLSQASALTADTAVNSVDVVASAFGGTLLDSAITAINNSSYNGIARSAVYDTGTGLDFYYQFTNDATSVNGVERFTGYSFLSLGATVVNVFQTAGAFGVFSTGTEVADGADRSSLGVVGFSFIPNGHSKIEPGSTSLTQIIRTDARSFTSGNFGLLDGIGDNAQAFAPTSAVPEPETYAMLLAGLGALVFVGRRRAKVAFDAQAPHFE